MHVPILKEIDEFNRWRRRTRKPSGLLFPPIVQPTVLNPYLTREIYLMFRAFVLLFLAIGCLAACATAPQKKPQSEAMIVEANSALALVAEETEQLFQDVMELHREVKSLYDHPGWPDMKQIIEIMGSAEESEGEACGELADAAARWTRKWNEPWEVLFARYLMLVKRCSILEARRLALQSRLTGVQAKYIGAAALEYANGRVSRGKSLEDVAETLNKSREELDESNLNSLGLCE